MVCRQLTALRLRVQSSLHLLPSTTGLFRKISGLSLARPRRRERVKLLLKCFTALCLGSYLLWNIIRSEVTVENKDVGGWLKEQTLLIYENIMIKKEKRALFIQWSNTISCNRDAAAEMPNDRRDIMTPSHESLLLASPRAACLLAHVTHHRELIGCEHKPWY